MRPPAGSSGLVPMLTQRCCRLPAASRSCHSWGVAVGSQPLRLDLAPDAAHAVGAQELQGRRVALEHAARSIEHDHPPGKRIQQQPQAARQRFLLLVLGTQLAIGHCQLGGQANHLILQILVGGSKLRRGFVEQRESLLQLLGRGQFRGVGAT